MSRIGKKNIAVPEKVEIKVDGNAVQVKGPKGVLKRTVPEGFNFEQKDKKLKVTPKAQLKTTNAMWGLTRTLVANMVRGVTEGYSKNLEFNGVGYKAHVQGRNLVLSLGHSHPIEYTLPEHVDAKVVKNLITISGVDKELIGFVSAKIRDYRGPEPYKGKGIKYENEVIIRKAGKTGAKK